MFGGFAELVKLPGESKQNPGNGTGLFAKYSVSKEGTHWCNIQWWTSCSLPVAIVVIVY